jgi:hypothetical protein
MSDLTPALKSKKKPAAGSGLNLFSWRRIEETDE